MKEEYTPTTEKVKRAYSGLHEKNYYDFTFMQREENFDRWLADHDALIRAEAWDEGWNAGVDDANFGPRPKTSNPYRKEQK